MGLIFFRKVLNETLSEQHGYFHTVQFGKTLHSELDRIDFSLPTDHENNRTVLGGKPSEGFEFFIGTTEWGRKDWVGNLYPQRAKPVDFLKHYARQFNSIELNPTHYRIPSKDLVDKWVNAVPEDFLFCPKVYQQISHQQVLRNCEPLNEVFCDSIRHFNEQLGTVFLQVQPSFGPSQFSFLRTFLEQWPSDISLALELRDAEWYRQTSTAQELFAMLEELQVGAVITDTGKYRELVHMRLAVDELFIRFVGNGLHPTDYSRIDAWVEQIAAWQNQGLKRVYFFVHQHDGKHAPELIIYTAKAIAKRLNISVRYPEFLQRPIQGELF